MIDRVALFARSPGVGTVRNWERGNWSFLANEQLRRANIHSF